MYVLMGIGLFILSEFLINVGLNSNYKDIERKDENSQIVVYQAEAAYSNGRIRGIIKDTEQINGKYLKVELYSKRDIVKARSYVEVKNNEENTQPFELLFKAQEVEYYKIDVVNEKEQEEFKFIPEDWINPEFMFAKGILLLVLLG